MNSTNQTVPAPFAVSPRGWHCSRAGLTNQRRNFTSQPKTSGFQCLSKCIQRRTIRSSGNTFWTSRT